MSANGFAAHSQIACCRTHRSSLKAYIRTQRRYQYAVHRAHRSGSREGQPAKVQTVECLGSLPAGWSIHMSASLYRRLRTNSRLDWACSSTISRADRQEHAWVDYLHEGIRALASQLVCTQAHDFVSFEVRGTRFLTVAEELLQSRWQRRWNA